MTATTITPLATYRNETPYPFCPGCGHGSILDSLNKALVELDLDPAKVVLVSDIGCSGLSDQYFATSAFHGLHGRSLTYAAGIKLARPELEVIVVMGDGGAGIGGAHLLNAARRNVGLTLLVFNNMNFGMTGGQHSVATPFGAVTSTTPGGNLERPLDIAGTAAVNGAAYVWRGTNFDGELPARIVEAVRHPGFALLDVWELCTAYFMPSNKLSKKSLGEMMDGLGFQHGLIQRLDVPEYTAAYRAAWADETAKASTLAPRPMEAVFEASLDRRFHLVVAGSAGGRVRSAARLLVEAAVLSGLWATQRDDYPITVKSGHSLSEVVLSPERIEYTGGKKPDALILLSEDGRKKSAGFLRAMAPEDRLFLAPSLAEVESQARRSVVDPTRAPGRLPPAQLALAALAAAVEELGILPLRALEEAVRRGPTAHVDNNLKAIAAGRAMVGD